MRFAGDVLVSAFGLVVMLASAVSCLLLIAALLMPAP